MRVLWITNNPLPDFIPAITGQPALGGSWIIALATALTKHTDIKLGIVTNVPGAIYQKLENDSVTQYVIPLNKKNGLAINDLYPELIRYYQKVEEDFSPDVIHIHGTERYFGLLSARKLLKAPAIISIQGIITSYFNSQLGNIAEAELKRKRSVKNLFFKGGIINQREEYRKYIPIEEEILGKNTYYFCRTSWDRGEVTRFNDDAVIFEGEELLRTSFYKTAWSLHAIIPNSIFISSGSIPIKGLHVLLKAAAILKQRYPDVLVRIPLDPKKFYRKSVITSNDYEIYLNDIIEKNNLKENISLLGKLNEGEMASAMATSHVFVLPSFNENSPNALGEAMIVGTPSVVSPVGGVPDIVQDDESALFAPAGDAETLAQRIGQIFDSRELALRLSKNAKRIALRRHDIPSAIKQYTDAYQTILEREHPLLSQADQVHAIHY